MAISSSEKKLLVACAFAVLIVPGVALFNNSLNQTPAIVTPPFPPAPQPNGYDLYVQATATITRAKPPVEARWDVEILSDPKLRARRYGLNRKIAWLAQNKAGLTLLKRAQQLPTVPPRRGFDKSLDIRPLLHLQRVKVVQSNAHWMRGEHHLALQSGLDIVQLSHDIQQGGGSLDYQTGNALSSSCRDTASDTIGYLNANQAKAGARRIEKLLETRWTLQQAWREDKYREQMFWLQHFKLRNWRLIGLLAVKTPTNPTWQDWAKVHSISKAQIISDVGAKYDHEIANLALPQAQRNRLPPFASDPFANYIQLFGRVHFTAARALTADRVLMLRLALHAHKREVGTYPPTLKALIPAYIQAVPADPFGKGESLRYKSDGQTYTLWSIGPDGRDDGGTPVSWRKKAPKTYADKREQLPPIFSDSLGDYVAGKNH